MSEIEKIILGAIVSALVGSIAIIYNTLRERQRELATRADKLAVDQQEMKANYIERFEKLTTALHEMQIHFLQSQETLRTEVITTRHEVRNALHQALNKELLKGE